MAHVLTVNELKKFCTAAAKAGHGNKKIMIPDDDECNGYHALYSQFTEIDDPEDYGYCNLPFEADSDNLSEDWITLG